MFLMFIGLTLVEMAQVRSKNRNFVIQKNVILMFLSMLIFFVLGYSFAYGESSAGVIGA